MIKAGNLGNSSAGGSSPPEAKAPKGGSRNRPPSMQAEIDSAVQDKPVSVRLGVLQRLVNGMGDLAIQRTRMEQQSRSMAHNLDEFARVLQHMQKHLRVFELETEAAISQPRGKDSRAVQHDLLHRPHLPVAGETARALSGSVDELSGIGVKLRELCGDLHSLLLQQAGISNELEDGLLGDHTLPVVPATADVLLVEVADKLFAIPHGIVDWIGNARVQELMDGYAGTVPGLHYAGQEYPLLYLGAMLGLGQPVLADSEARYPVLLVNTGKERVAIQVDQQLGNSRVTIQALGAVLGNLGWFTGGTILADGNIALLLDLQILLRSNDRRDRKHE